MSPRQTQLYFREWGKVRAHFVAQGIDPKLADAKRHELHKRALGAMKSSKLFTNADLDKVLAVFFAITRPADLNAQLRQQDQAVHRLQELKRDLLDLAAQCGVNPGREGQYVSGIANNVFGVETTHLDEPQLQQIAGILRRRIKQIEHRADTYFPKQRRGVHAKAAAKAEEEGDPF